MGAGREGGERAHPFKFRPTSDPAGQGLIRPRMEPDGSNVDDDT